MIDTTGEREREDDDVEIHPRGNPPSDISLDSSLLRIDPIYYGFMRPNDNPALKEHTAFLLIPRVPILIRNSTG